MVRQKCNEDKDLEMKHVIDNWHVEVDTRKVCWNGLN